MWEEMKLDAIDAGAICACCHEWIGGTPGVKQYCSKACADECGAQWRSDAEWMEREARNAANRIQAS